MRTSSKLVVLDPDGRVLLLDCADPGDPRTRWWELPGGGIEAGEDGAAAAVREVREETGVLVPPEVVGPLLWTQRASFTWVGRRHEALHEARVARLPGPPVLAPTELAGDEAATLRGQRWWDPQELTASRERFFPRHLPALLPRLLAGERVDEPYDDWDVDEDVPGQAGQDLPVPGAPDGPGPGEPGLPGGPAT